MWKCPDCNREFKNTNQQHFCGVPEKTVDSYIEAQALEIRPLLYQIRDTIRCALPDEVECISWGMPTYKKKYNIIHFAAHKKHIGLYPGDKAIEHFADRLSEFKKSKGAIQFPYDEPLPLELIADIAKWCNETGNYH